MAKLFPALPLLDSHSTELAAELGVVHRLGAGLSEAFTVFHRVNRSRGSAAAERHGEIDAVAANQAGDLLLIEVKAGGVEFRAEGIFKRYGQQSRDVTAQVRLQCGALRSRLERAGLSVRLHHLLVLPDVKVKSETVQWPRERRRTGQPGRARHGAVRGGRAFACAERQGDRLPGEPLPGVPGRVRDDRPRDRNVAVVSLRGRERSTLLHADRPGQ